MPKIVKNLTAIKIKNSKPKEKLYKLSDGGGLSLWIYPSGNKSWVLSLQKNGKRQDLRKPFNEKTLAEARLWREETKIKLDKGEPISKKELDRYIFNTIFNEWLKRWQPEVSEKYGKQVENSIRRDILPDIGYMDIREIKPVNIVEALKSFEERGALEYLRRTKTGLNQCFDFAISRGLIDMNPVANVSTKAFKKHISKNLRALPPEELPNLIETIEKGRRADKVTVITYYAFYWELITMTRSKETATAQWEHIDLDNKLWVIPAEVMKMKRDHRVPLSPFLLEILDELKLHNVHGKYLFEGLKNHISRETILKMLKRLDINSTSHGLRSLARTYLREIGKFEKDALEMSLAHVTGSKTELAYDRSELLEERREIINYWSETIKNLRLKSLR